MWDVREKTYGDLKKKRKRMVALYKRRSQKESKV